ncbi:uncharacterized protein B0I36DRAFT_69521 [Microdochium trichocladiopsis]|uniref:Uncharacterized protein n=1 Tax=Microdochium trichocladiopsis TaxID=1682393 RepID=A0A9P8YEB7_9PEZI|nr:uncharacterized protein B0I36DRAFT_69521 [Microdochium trichocladiopsis]KAH7037669.1 hypothetical protein B0I36DRAFT_69521 [Microdochium trichocladiopsis]
MKIHGRGSFQEIVKAVESTQPGQFRCHRFALRPPRVVSGTRDEIYELTLAYALESGRRGKRDEQSAVEMQRRGAQVWNPSFNMHVECHASLFASAFAAGSTSRCLARRWWSWLVWSTLRVVQGPVLYGTAAPGPVCSWTGSGNKERLLLVTQRSGRRA